MRSNLGQSVVRLFAGLMLAVQGVFRRRLTADEIDVRLRDIKARLAASLAQLEVCQKAVAARKAREPADQSPRA